MGVESSVEWKWNGNRIISGMGVESSVEWLMLLTFQLVCVLSTHVVHDPVIHTEKVIKLWYNLERLSPQYLTNERKLCPSSLLDGIWIFAAEVWCVGIWCYHVGNFHPCKHTMMCIRWLHLVQVGIYTQAKLHFECDSSESHTDSYSC